MDVECLVEIKEEPTELEDEVEVDHSHSETLFVREEHYDFHGILKDVPAIQHHEIVNNVKDDEVTFVKEERPKVDKEEVKNDIQPAATSKVSEVKPIKTEISDDDDDDADDDTEGDWFGSQKIPLGHACPVCTKTFTRRSDLRRHEKIHLKPRSKSGKRSKIFKTKHDEPIPEADSALSALETFTCNVCCKNFSRRDILKRHLKHKHPNDEQTIEQTRMHCKVCSKFFKNDIFLSMHMKLHAGQNPYECDYCHKDLKTGSHLVEHLRIHTGEKPFKCDLCNMPFARLNGVRKHKEIHHGIISQEKLLKKLTVVKKEKEILCSLCAKKFTRNDSLKIHMRSHTGEKPFMCDICSKSFSYRNTLRDHVRLHTGEKPFECTICRQKFIRANDMKEHTLRIHFPEKIPVKKVLVDPDERRYGCETCFKRFKSRSNLSTHRRSHTGERPYVCDVCQKGFITAGDMRVHVRIHTGEKPYKCNGCEEAFRVKPLLTKHMKRCRNFTDC